MRTTKFDRRSWEGNDEKSHQNRHRTQTNLRKWDVWRQREKRKQFSHREHAAKVFYSEAGRECRTLADFGAAATAPPAEDSPAGAIWSFLPAAGEDETSFSLSRSECRCLRLRPGNLIRRTPDGEHADPFLLLFSAAAAGTLPTSKCAPAHATHSVSASEWVQPGRHLQVGSVVVRSIGAANSSTHTR